MHDYYGCNHEFLTYKYQNDIQSLPCLLHPPARLIYVSSISWKSTGGGGYINDFVTGYFQSTCVFDKLLFNALCLKLDNIVLYSFTTGNYICLLHLYFQISMYSDNPPRPGVILHNALCNCPDV